MRPPIAFPRANKGQALRVAASRTKKATSPTRNARNPAKKPVAQTEEKKETRKDESKEDGKRIKGPNNPQPFVARPRARPADAIIVPPSAPKPAASQIPPGTVTSLGHSSIYFQDFFELR